MKPLNESSNIRWLIKLIIQSYFVRLNSIVIVYDSSNITSVQYDYLKGINDVLSERTYENSFVVQWININHLRHEQYYKVLLDNCELGSQGYITIIPNTNKFISIKYEVTETSFVRQKDKIFLFLTEGENSSLLLNNENLELYPNHLMVIPISNSKIIEFWTQKYVGSENYGDPILINILFENKTFLNREINTLYPDKFMNLQGRALNITTVKWIPYIVCYIMPPGKGNVDSFGTSSKDIFLNGTEASLVIEFCKRRNCSVKVLLYGKDDWGAIYPNDTADGMFGALYRREVDLSVSGLYGWYANDFDVSQSITKSSVTLLVPKPLPYPPYLIAILPFKSSVWILLITFMFLSSVFYHRVKVYLFKMERNRKHRRMAQNLLYTLLEVYAMFLHQALLQRRFTHSAVRICIAFFLFGALTLENSYSGDLASLLTVPKYMNPIDTVYKFSKSGLKWGSTHSTWKLTLENSDFPFELEIVANFESRTSDEFRNLSFSNNYALGVERLHAGSFAFGSYIKWDALKNFIMLKDDIFYDFTRAIAVRGWPLMDQFNDIILHSKEHGLLEAWESRITGEYLDPKTEIGLRQLSVGHIGKPSPAVITLKHVSGAFLTLLIGFSAAIAAFILEIFVHRINFKIFKILSNKIVKFFRSFP